MGKKRKLIQNTRGKRFFAAVNTALVIVLTAAIFASAASYRQLKASIQDERAASVEQIAALITDRVSQLRQSYLKEAEQTAGIIQNSGTKSLSELRRLLQNSGRIVLADETGRYTAPDGSRPVIDGPELISQLEAGKAAGTYFATIQTRGDYWLFAVPLRGVTMDGVNYIGVVLLVSADEYSSVATISLYDQMGESLVVAGDGTVKMRPAHESAEGVFSGYNILKILENSDMTPQAQGDFAQALQRQKEYSASCRMNGVTWLIQSMPSDSGRSIVVAVPISLTAQQTYAGMTMTFLHILISIATLVLIFIYNFTSILRKNQAAEVEHARAKSKSDFLDKMSHDIRTPLNAVVGMHELALQSIDDRATVYDCLIKSKKSCDYLVSVINDVLDMSRIESGKMTVSHTQFALAELLDDVIGIEASAAAEKEISLKLDILTPIETDFVGDAQRLRQCLVNLINNAVKFTPRGGMVKLTCSCREQEAGRAEICFTVADNGVGMSEEFMGKLFKPFEQEQNSLYNSYAGSGLGLSIVHDFVELMGGTVTAESRKNEGSTFVITLPLETAPMEARPAAETTDGDLVPLLSGKRVLLAEDNAINRQIISLLLQKMGLAVDEAENGRAAADKFAASPPGGYALILMDIMMPVMGGLEAAAEIRRLDRPDAGTIPIVALSANAFEEDARKSLDAGMQMHLAKPVDVQELRRVLKKYIVQEVPKH